MKKYISLFAILLAAAFTVQAEVGMVSFGITNTIGKDATTSVNLGSALSVTGQDNIGLMLKTAGSEAGTGLVTITFARSPDNVNWETSPRFTWVNSLNGVTPVVGYTNIPSSVIGAAGYIKVVSIVNADANVNGTNSALYLVKKTIKAAP